MNSRMWVRASVAHPSEGGPEEEGIRTRFVQPRHVRARGDQLRRNRARGTWYSLVRAKGARCSLVRTTRERTRRVRATRERRRWVRATNTLTWTCVGCRQVRDVIFGNTMPQRLFLSKKKNTSIVSFRQKAPWPWSCSLPCHLRPSNSRTNPVSNRI